MKLRVQVALVSMIVTALILGLSGVLAIRLVLNQVVGTADQALQARSRSIERRLVFSSTRPVLPFEIPSNFRGFGPSRVVPLAQLLTDSGKVLSTFGGASTKALLSGPLHIPAPGVSEFYSLSRSHGMYRVLVERSAFNGHELVLIALPIGPDLALVNRLRDVLIIIWMLSVMMSGFGSYLLARRVLAPVERLRRRAAEAEISAEAISLPVPQTHDEVEALGQTMNSLLGRLQGALADQHRFLSNASHELRTPLAALRLELELAVSTERSEEELRRSSQEALTTTETLVDLVERLFTLSVLDERIPISDSNELDIVEICQDAVALRAEQAKVCDVALELCSMDSEVIVGERAYLTLAVSTLIDNAIRFSNPSGTVTVEVTSKAVPNCEKFERQVSVAVTNHGPGFPLEYLPQAFDRFSRPDEARPRVAGGAGLGLALVKSIAEAHQGFAEIVAPGPGETKVRFVVPSQRNLSKVS